MAKVRIMFPNDSNMISIQYDAAEQGSERFRGRIAMVMENGVRKAEKPQTCQCMKRGAESTYERREYYERVARATGNKNLCSDRDQRVLLTSYEVSKFGPFCLGTNIFSAYKAVFVAVQSIMNKE
jgi:hypothetical protein